MQYQPTWESIKSHPRPQWFDDAKLGIFIHWGLYSVPAWANTNWELGAEPTAYEWFSHGSYAEWYLNTIRIKESEAWAYHKKTYGEDFPYEKFAEMFTCKNWNPAQWADAFKDAGAEYVVLTAKHHDGFCLYPSDYTDYNSVKQGPKRDLTGELTQAVRDAGLKMGLYFSGLLDWTFDLEPIVDHGHFQQKYALKPEHVAISRNQTMELIDKYKPSLLWGDIGWPIKGEKDLPEIFSHYYNSVPQGLTNDRWNGLWQDYFTAEYLLGMRGLDFKWEMCRGLGLSFGYNQNEDESTMLSSRELVELLCEYVSANGNLLINVGPKADGTIPKEQLARLADLGAWLKKHGEAIYGTRPYMPCQSEVLPGGAKVYYTQKGGVVFAILCGLDKGKHTVNLPALGKDVTVEVPDEMPVYVRG